jgi:hypothetical protein
MGSRDLLVSGRTASKRNLIETDQLVVPDRCFSLSALNLFGPGKGVLRAGIVFLYRTVELRFARDGGRPNGCRASGKYPLRPA